MPPSTPAPAGRARAHELVDLPGSEPIEVSGHRRGDEVEIELAGRLGIEPDGSTIDAVTGTVTAVSEAIDMTGATWHLAADHPADALHPLVEAVADRKGLATRRDLLQLRRALPVPADDPTRAGAPPIRTRPFRPGHDDEAWTTVNNRSFAGHPDQGEEDTATLADRTAERWFDPAGFLVADDPRRPGALSGFCWTKEHDATEEDPRLGEIYVIGVDPSHQGEGLGRSLVLAGLDHLGGRGIAVANLYVEADNAAALALYDRLGFDVHQRRRVYTP